MNGCQVRSCVSFVQKSLVKVMGQNSTSIFSQLTRFMNGCQVRSCVSFDQKSLVKVMRQNSPSIFSQLARFMNGCQVRSCVSFDQKSLVKVMGQISPSIFSQLTRFMNDYRSSPGTSNDARLLSNSTSCDLGVPLGCLFGSAGPSWGLLGTLEGLAFLLRFPKERASGTDAFGILMPKG